MKIGNHIIFIESDIMRPCNIRISDVVASADKALAYFDVVRLEHRLINEVKFNLYYKFDFNKKGMRIGKNIINLDWQAEQKYVVRMKKQTTLALRAKLHLLKGLYNLETDLMASLKTQLRENR